MPDRDIAELFGQRGSPAPGTLEIRTAEPDVVDVRGERPPRGHGHCFVVHFATQPAGDLHRLDLRFGPAGESAADGLLQASLNIVE